MSDKPTSEKKSWSEWWDNHPITFFGKKAYILVGIAAAIMLSLPKFFPGVSIFYEHIGERFGITRPFYGIYVDGQKRTELSLTDDRPKLLVFQGGYEGDASSNVPTNGDKCRWTLVTSEHSTELNRVDCIVSVDRRRLGLSRPSSATLELTAETASGESIHDADRNAKWLIRVYYEGEGSPVEFPGRLPAGEANVASLKPLNQTEARSADASGFPREPTLSVHNGPLITPEFINELASKVNGVANAERYRRLADWLKGTAGALSVDEAMVLLGDGGDSAARTSFIIEDLLPRLDQATLPSATLPLVVQVDRSVRVDAVRALAECLHTPLTPQQWTELTSDLQNELPGTLDEARSSKCPYPEQN